MTRLAAAIIAATLAAASAAAQAPPAAPSAPAHGTIQPGTYDLTIVFGGGLLDGTLEVARAGDSLTVKLAVGDHASPVAITERQGNRLILGSTTPGLNIRYQLDFTEGAVTGEFSYDGETGRVTGRRRAAGS